MAAHRRRSRRPDRGHHLVSRKDCMATTAVSEKLDLLTGSTGAQVLRAAERAHLPGQFQAVLEMLTTHADVEWLPFGGNSSRVPHSALGAAADPDHLLAE